MKNCLFCTYDKGKFIAENDFAFAIYDNFPVNEGHSLIIPKRHFANFFEATEEEIAGIYSMLHEVKGIVDKKYSPTGYNVGINVGEDGGQTIMHLHVHLIPRYKGDVENPKGGIRKLKKELVPYNG
ncbi:MAG: HIT family protein [Clostridium sp.]|uniref:HIT family protein n=1 Tax=Clostridium TaxID=1485 RepID=UPI00189A22CA|nr:MULTISPECIES: HIT family protein [Clostridium]MDU5209341.1 HIT family protein [Clostridium sp.]MDU6761515.1 HIT family protein [Clostridium sp.]